MELCATGSIKVDHRSSPLPPSSLSATKFNHEALASFAALYPTGFRDTLDIRILTKPVMTDITQHLPPELLVEILRYLTVPDILKLKQVNRVFRDIVTSPLIQHRIDLFAAGLECNAEAGINLADSQKALLQYRSGLDSLRPIEVKAVSNLEPDDLDENYMRAAGGVYAIVKDPVRLFTLGFVSRGIPQKEWEIPLPVANPAGYSFYPDANVITFVELQEASNMQIAIHLNTLSDGEYHPAAQRPIIYYSQKQTVAVADTLSVSITSTRLAILASVQFEECLVILDWRSAQVLFELKEKRYTTAEFIDDYRLLVSLDSTVDTPPSLVVMDTEQTVGGVPMQTFFHLSPWLVNSGMLFLLLERGAHNPSPAESLAPFHQDPAQRIVVLDPRSTLYYLVLRVGALLDLLEGREGSDIAWDEWKSNVTIPFFKDDHTTRINASWVSGCRFFVIISILGTSMRVYDFSTRGRVKYLSDQADEEFGGVGYLLPSKERVEIPWSSMHSAQSGHDSIVFCHEPEEDHEGDDPNECFVHIWTF